MSLVYACTATILHACFQASRGVVAMPAGTNNLAAIAAALQLVDVDEREPLHAFLEEAAWS